MYIYACEKLTIHSVSKLFFEFMTQNMKEDYGQFVWPCSIVLAQYVWQQRLQFCGASVVEVIVV